LHLPISVVMEFPVHELNLWAEVYKTEYYDAHPEEREEMQSQESDIMTSKVLALIGGDVQRGDAKCQLLTTS